jgi:hypothetical protein
MPSADAPTAGRRVAVKLCSGPRATRACGAHRSKCQLTTERVRLGNQLEALLEEMGIKLSAVVSDLLGASGRKILAASMPA